MADARLRTIARPLVGLLSLAAIVGLVAGLRAVPPSETEIIDRVVAGYIDETDGAPTDCHAVISPLDRVRLVVVCRSADGAEALYPVDERGRVLKIADPFAATEPQT